MFYDKYAEICKMRGISMSAAAMEAGLSKSLVTKWKTNAVEVPSPDVLTKLSKYFGIPVSELLGEENRCDEGIKKEQSINLDELPEKKRELVKFAMSLSEEQSQRMLHIMQTILATE